MYGFPREVSDPEKEVEGGLCVGEGGYLNNTAAPSILDCIDYASLSHMLALAFSPLLSLPPRFLSVLPPSLRSALGFFHLWQITVTLLYNNFLPALAVLLKTAKAERNPPPSISALNYRGALYGGERTKSKVSVAEELL